MGIVTICIGTGPVGVMIIGVLSGRVGPPVAILIMAGLGLCGLSLLWRKLKGQTGGSPARRAIARNFRERGTCATSEGAGFSPFLRMLAGMPSGRRVFRERQGN